MGCCKSRAFKASPDCVPGLQSQPCPYVPYPVPYYPNPPPFYYLQPPIWDPYNPPQQFNMPVAAKFKEYITSYEPQPAREVETLYYYKQQNEYEQHRQQNEHRCYSQQPLIVPPAQQHSCNNCRQANNLVLEIPSNQAHSSTQYTTTPQVVHIQLASAPAPPHGDVPRRLHHTPSPRCIHTPIPSIRPSPTAQVVFQHHNQPPSVLCQGHMGVSHVLVLKRQRHVCKRVSPVEKQDSTKRAIDNSNRSSSKSLNKSSVKSGPNRKPLSCQTRSKGSMSEVLSIPSPIYE